MGNGVIGQSTWNYNFGDGVGVHSSGASSSYLPTLSSGVARVGVGGGNFNLDNPGINILVDLSKLTIVAPTTGSVINF